MVDFHIHTINSVRSSISSINNDDANEEEKNDLKLEDFEDIAESASLNTNVNIAEYFKTNFCEDNSDSSEENIDQNALSVILMEQYSTRFENVKHM